MTAIRDAAPQTAIHFVGSDASLDRDLIEAAGVDFTTHDTVMAGPLHGVNPLTALTSLFKLLVGTLQAVALMLRYRPQAVFLTGGWVGFPIAVAGVLLRRPILIFVPDIEPGLTLKVLGRFASVITATTEDTGPFFPKKKVVATGYPLREEVLTATREAGQARFGLAADKTTLLVFGGSRGAKSLNEALLHNAETLLANETLQIVHATGSATWAESKAQYDALPEPLQQRYHITEYLHHMGEALAAADLVVSRAGASTLGEFPYFALPSILVPYPYAWRYQKVNADWLVARGAAVLLEDERLETELASTILVLLADRLRLDAMRDAAQASAQGDGAAQIAKVIIEAMR